MFYERLMLIWKIWLNKIFKYKISTIIKFRKEKRNNLKLKNNYSRKIIFIHNCYNNRVTMQITSCWSVHLIKQILFSFKILTFEIFNITNSYYTILQTTAEQQ